MRNECRWAFCLIAAAGVAATSAAMAAPAPGQSKTGPGVKTLLAPELKPALIGKNEIEGWRPLPPGRPLRRYVVGQGVVEGGTAGATGVVKYSNTDGAIYFPPGMNVPIADDLTTTCAGSEMTFLELMVTGGDDTGPAFSIQFELYDGCPHDGGMPIAGTSQSANLPDGGAWLVTFDTGDAPIAIPGTVWLSITFVDSDLAGPVMGAPATIGSSADLFDGPQPPLFECSTFFGGCPPNPCANFFARVFALEETCLAVFLAYESDSFSGFFGGMELNEQFADDIQPITFPKALCSITRLDVDLAGLEGAYTMHNEVWTNDPNGDPGGRPMAPVLGTMGSFTGLGNGFLETGSYMFPAVEVSTPQLWVTYDVDTHSAGPILSADFPDIGFSDDCFSLFGNPDPGMFSPCVWFYGGCPMNETGNPCGTFNAAIFCAGNAPMGACCDVTSAGTSFCADDTVVTDCNGRFVLDALCAPDPFDPPCGQASCCVANPNDPTEPATCENRFQATCSSSNHLWQPGQFCGLDEQTCPPAACILATNPCDVANDNAPGCSDVFCCSTVCANDDFCCGVAWDQTCVNQAVSCPQPGPDTCQEAIEIPCGTTAVLDNSLATDIGSDPGYSCHNAGADENGIGSVWAKFVPTDSSVRLSTCDSVSPADDSLVAIYTGTCGSLNEISCSDDVAGCHPVTGFNSDLCVGGLIPGQTYYIQLAAWTEDDRGAYALKLECPAPPDCGPPANDLCADAIQIGNGTFTFNCSAATTDGPGLPAQCDEGFGLPFGHDLWYNYTATSTGPVEVDLCTGTPYDSRMSAYSGCGCPPTNGNLVACNDDGCGNPPVVGAASNMTFNAVAGTCYKIRVGGFGAEAGSGTMTISGEPATCPTGQITILSPPNNVVDARQPNPVNSPMPLQGISVITASGPAGAPPSCWTMCETGINGTPNSIANVSANGGTYTITLARPITPGHVTRLGYSGATVGTFISHPANINGDGLASPVDILRIIDCLNGLPQPVNCPWGLFSQDIDQSGALGPADILKTVDLLNGADVFIPWNNTPLPSGMCTP